MSQEARSTRLGPIQTMTSVPLPEPKNAIVFPLVSQPSKLIVRAYGPDSAASWSATVKLFTTDLVLWDSEPIVTFELTNVDFSGTSKEIPCIQEYFGVEVTVNSGTPDVAQTNGVVGGINVTIQRGW